MSTKRVLVVRGASDLQEAGSLARLESDEALVLLAPGGEVLSEDDVEARYVEIDPADCALAECLEEIKEAWEEVHADDGEGHLGHAAAGFFLFYWLAPDTRSILTLAREGRSQDLRDAARDYIESGFAQSRGPTLAVTPA